MLLLKFPLCDAVGVCGAKILASASGRVEAEKKICQKPEAFVEAVGCVQAGDLSPQIHNKSPALKYLDVTHTSSRHNIMVFPKGGSLKKFIAYSLCYLCWFLCGY